MKKGPIGKLMVAMSAVLAVSLIIAVVLVVRDAADGKPIASTDLDLASPDGSWLATLETVDNGLGYGQGMRYAEVHLHRPGEVISGHGDRETSAVFYIDLMRAGARTPVLRWRDANHLAIGYDGGASIDGGPGKQVRAYRDVTIEYYANPPAAPVPPVL